jgi:hypothetical protein
VGAAENGHVAFGIKGNGCRQIDRLVSQQITIPAQVTAEQLGARRQLDLDRRVRCI